MSIRIIASCTEFGQVFSAGQIPTGLSALSEFAMVASGLASYIGAAPSISWPDSGVVPITTVQFANPSLYGLDRSSARTYELGTTRMRYHWSTTGWAAGGLTATKLAAVDALVSGGGITKPRPASRGLLLWDFTTLSGYSVNNSGIMALVSGGGDTSAQLGKATDLSIRFTIPASTTSELSFPAITAPQILNSSIAIVVEVISGAGNETNNWYLGVTGAYANGYLKSGSFGYYGMNVIAPTQNGTINQFTTIGVAPAFNTLTASKFRVTAGAQDVVVIVHGVVGAQSSPPTVCLIQDDGDITAYTEWAPRFNQYRFKAGFGIIRDLIGTGAGFLTTTMLDQLNAEGHDLIPHGQYNLNTFGSAALANADIAANRDYLLNRGYPRAGSLYVYPNGNSEYSTADRSGIRNYLAQIGVKAAFGVGSSGFAVIGKLGAFNYSRYAMDAAALPATVLANVDANADCGRNTAIMVHRLLAAGATGSDCLRADADTLLAGLWTRQKAGSIRVVSPMELAGEAGLLS